MVWFSEDAIENWLAPSKSGKAGRPKLYSDEAILTALIIRSVYHLPLRALQGFLESLLLLFAVGLTCPSYTQICRRSKLLGQKLKKLSKKRVTDVVIDSTGLKVYGEGEWKVRQHGARKRRTWRKLHLAVCPDSHEIIMEILTDNGVADCEVYPELMKGMPQSVERTYGDRAYDTRQCYAANEKHGSIPIIPPKKNAILREDLGMVMAVRNKHLREIRGFGGDEVARGIWKKLRGYHRRSLAETAMCRYKRLFGSDLKSRTLANQKAETRAKCMALNTMTRLGMPRSELSTV